MAFLTTTSVLVIIIASLCLPMETAAVRYVLPSPLSPKQPLPFPPRKVVPTFLHRKSPVPPSSRNPVSFLSPERPPTNIEHSAPSPLTPPRQPSSLHVKFPPLLPYHKSPTPPKSAKTPPVPPTPRAEHHGTPESRMTPPEQVYYLPPFPNN